MQNKHKVAQMETQALRKKFCLMRCYEVSLLLSNYL